MAGLRPVGLSRVVRVVAEEGFAEDASLLGEQRPELALAVEQDPTLRLECGAARGGGDRGGQIE
jgi:hypothetical protein